MMPRALDQNEPRTCCEAAVDAERGAGAGVAADFGDSGEGGEEVGDMSVATITHCISFTGKTGCRYCRDE